MGIAERQGGPFTRAQALSCGVPDDELYRLVRRKQLRRLRRGAYVSSRLYDPLDDVARHIVMIRAVLLSLGERVVVSHASAAALHGLALWGVDLGRVHVTRLDEGMGRREAGVEHHVGFVDESEIRLVDGIRVVAADRAAVETALTAEFAAGVAVLDSVLHAGRATPDGLRALLDKMRAWPGSITAARAVSFADGRSESVGESRARVLFAQHGLPEPVLQAVIRDASGRFVGRVDFLFAAERTIVEFDGRVKYGTNGRLAADTVVAEKLREDLLRELGYEVVRITWADLADPERTVRRIRAAFARARRR
jgi:hypothetical protein